MAEYVDRGRCSASAAWIYVCFAYRACGHFYPAGGSYAPMAQGVLAGRYDGANEFPSDSRAARIGGVFAGRVTPSGIAVAKRLADLALEYGISRAQLAILWVKDQPAITAPIFGPRTLDQLEQILPVLDMNLSDELRAACDALVPPGSVVTNFHNGCTWMKQQVLGSHSGVPSVQFA